MITINLLPEEFRVKQKSAETVPTKKLAIAGGILFGVLTLFFFFDFLMAQGRLKKLENEWAALQPKSRELTQLQDEVESSLKPEKQFMDKFVTSQKPLTSFLVWVSEYLPQTAWLTEITMGRKGEGGSFFVKGLAQPSKEKSSIEQIETYLHQLQEKVPEANLSLTTTRQKIENFELTQFTANFEWGGKS